ncbi:hypothetical protein CHU95_04550 [Niveispirillum lacus]|uniref:Uncharacterized protein n=1 Tax=Niveispirillum lacus TaxID=1981099 RepID=A0A255Z4Q0_9PROT|nr:hypothetical protein [Niveispirillum lacus]OYQ36497.1 hypothetical protein CHU95_04550 [Niveispirillum lacus]
MREPTNEAGGKTAMGMAAFQALLEQYGAEPRRWPEDVRADAQLLLANSPQARMQQQQAAMLDAMLDRLDPPLIMDERVARVVAGALQDLPVPGLARRRDPFLQRALAMLRGWGQIVPRAAGLAACTAAGILVGAFTPVTATGAGKGGEVAATAVTAASDLPSALLTPSALESLFQ